MAKSPWKGDKGRRARAEAARTDAAGAMQVSPGTRRTGGVASGGGGYSTLGNALSSGSGMNPVRGPFAQTPAKLIAQGPTTGFGSFRNTVEPLPRETSEYM